MGNVLRRLFRTGVIAAWCVAGSLVAAAGAEPQPAGDAVGAKMQAGTIQGWRGDGTGRYPAADPPTTWSRLSKAARGLRCQAGEPKEGDAGTPMPDGVARQWLILGPVPVPADANPKKELLPGEAAFAPSDGDKAGGCTWKTATLDTAYLDFPRLLAPATPANDTVAYACTRIYSESGGPFRVNITCIGDLRVYLNGKPAPAAFVGRARLDLVKGWNRLLIRLAPGHSDQTPREIDWYVVPVFFAFQGTDADYEQTNIAWRANLPGAYPAFYGGGMGLSSPLIVGERMYMLCEPHDLVCLRKTDGKVLWVRRSSYAEVADEAERKNPAYADAAAAAAKLDAIAETLVAGGASGPMDKLFEQKIEQERLVQKAMKAVDGEKYKIESGTDVGFSGFTPLTDGKCIWTWSASGVSACYDLDGNRKWIRLDRRPAVEHGFTSSPALADGKLVVFMRDVMAFDAATGKLVWVNPVVGNDGFNPGGYFHGSLMAVDLAGTPAVALANGMILRARDGATLYGSRETTRQGVASPVVDFGEPGRAAGRNLIFVSSGNQMAVHELPDPAAGPLKLQSEPYVPPPPGTPYYPPKRPAGGGAKTWPLDLPTRIIDVNAPGFPKHYLPWVLSSPLVHDGLVYLVNNAGVLSVVDLAAGQVLYRKMLDLDVFQAHNEGAARGIGSSPTLAGKYIYVVGNNGATVVFEPGRTFKQVAKNKIESYILSTHWAARQERFMCNPVFDGKRMYVRGEEYLYAIEGK
jgi:outer membrane protein assembly factor BamB